MAYSGKTGLIDLFGGEQDLKDGILRCVGEPEKRFNEDALRIMRALRFMSERGYSCEANTERALRALKDNLLKIAPERISAEFDRLLLGDFVEQVILEYYDVLGVIFPELIKCAGFEQHNRHHAYDVLTHTAKAVAAAPKDLIIRLALFFHDIAKPACFVFQGGEGHFNDHPAKSGEIAEKTMRRLRYNKAAIYKAVILVENHRGTLKTDSISIKSMLNKYGLKTLVQLCEMKIADDSTKAEFVKLALHRHRAIIEKAQEIVEKNECYSLESLAVNGGDLTELGYSGREVGIKLQILLDKVITGQTENSKEALLKLIDKSNKA
jgi:tRNA nucleotidyltransferase (CCA-adding enzyme)